MRMPGSLVGRVRRLPPAVADGLLAALVTVLGLPQLFIVNQSLAKLDIQFRDADRVLILTTFDLDEYVLSALRAGASGFLLKDVPPEDLVEAIKVAMPPTASTRTASDAIISRRRFQRSATRPAGSANSVRDRARANATTPAWAADSVTARTSRG
jgi:DNA-binding NarL/FixJ family response regulator